MLKRLVVVAAVVGIPSLASGAFADRPPREASLSVTGGAAIMGAAEDPGPNRIGSMVGASLAWDHPPPAYPETDGTAEGHLDLVPELTLFSYGDRGGLLAGVRLEADLAQRGMGLFKVSARMSRWFAPRIGVIQGAQGPIVGGDFGEMFNLGRSPWRVGLTMGVLGWREAGGQYPTPIDGTIAFQAEPPGTHQLAITFGLIVSR
jgi:hypothetical protein